MRRMLMVMVGLVFVFGCEASSPRPEISRAESREPTAVTAPAPQPGSRSAALSVPAGRGLPGTDSSRAQRPLPLTASRAGREGQPAERREAAAEKQAFEGITGLVISETMTKIGNEFFEQFCLLWEPPTTGLSGYNVLISEKASPMWGAWITVSVDDVAIWNKVLKPRSEEIEAEVEEARAIVYEYVSNYDQYQMQTEDMRGTGF